jgi:thiamine pyrophosphate-dependent acetolactate synthase large subunit-like protein
VQRADAAAVTAAETGSPGEAAAAIAAEPATPHGPPTPGPAVRLDRPTTVGPSTNRPEWGSDVVVEMLRRLDVEYFALNPGASFRGLHDSVVNFAANQPGMILCNHEEIAVSVGHGYAKATGRAMAVGLHTNIGLLHGSMSIYNAFADRMPMLILGGTGPMDSTARRPGVDWHHTSNGIGSVVRDYVKWEQQPASVAALPEALLRAWQLAHTEPAGPVYVSLDVGVQEAPVPADLRLPDIARHPLPRPATPPPDAVTEAAAWLLEATRPVILVGDGGRTDAAWSALVELAELVAAPVIQDPRAIAAFPTDHPSSLAGLGPSRRAEVNAVLRGADVVLGLEFQALAGVLHDAASGRTDHYANLAETGRGDAPPPARVVNVSLDHLAVRSWATDFQELVPADIHIAASVEPTVAALVDAVRSLRRDRPAAARAADDRAKELRARRVRLETDWEQRRRERWDARPISMERAVGELGAALGPDREAAVLVRIPNTWASGVWELRRPLSYLGKDGGGGLGSAMAMAVGTALGVSGSGRLVVTVLGDGDALFAPSALWTAAHYRLPTLFVVANNRSYFNDEGHQAHMAVRRQRPAENRWLGMRIEGPEVDYAGLARSLGVEAVGSIERPEDLAAAYATAVSAVREGRPALVDVVIARD